VSEPKLTHNGRFTRFHNGSKLTLVHRFFLATRRLRLFLVFASGCASTAPSIHAQEPAQRPAAAQAVKSAQDKQPELPAQIELLETRVRFEANGDSRKEVHTRVHINNELGVRQFARLNFDHNRSFQQIELPLVRITQASGGTVDILPSAISDQPHPTVVNAPAYQDVRVKSVRILGLEPGDTLEYRVMTTTTNHPLAPDFWLEHSFDRSGVVSQEIFELDLPASRAAQLLTSAAAHDYQTARTDEGSDARLVYRWKRPPATSETVQAVLGPPISWIESDVALTTFGSWAAFQVVLQKSYKSVLPFTTQAKATTLTRGSGTPEDKLRALYNFVSKEIHIVDLPLDSTGFRSRAAESILSSGYATPEEKCTLLSALAMSVGLRAQPAFTLSGTAPLSAPPVPSILRHGLVMASFKDRNIWLDPSVEVAPFAMIASNMRGRAVVPLYPPTAIGFLANVPKDLPFPGTQHVKIDATLKPDGALAARVQYTMRGDTELLLRVAFHQAPKDKWKEVAQLLALSDGFRGTVTNVTASDPYATREPFAVEYEITQRKFVDWSKPVRIPALLPLVGLPDPPANSAAGSPSSPINLGTPLEVQTRVTLHVPPDTSIRAPVGTSVEREYATFSSEYSARNLTLTAERHIKFLRREIPAAHTADYAAFVRSVQNDQAQEFTLERRDSAPSTRAIPAKQPGASSVSRP
jgi:hypothetical protein